MQVECVFLDNGGVITDNGRRGPEYRRLVGEFFVPRFGGAAEAWETANATIFPAAWGRFTGRLTNWAPAVRDIVQETSLYYLDWLRSMFDAVGGLPPLSDAHCIALGREADQWINRQLQTRFPGADDAIAALARRFRLFTASDGFSTALPHALGESATAFERLYGPDLVNVPKQAGRPYYTAIFAHAAVDPARSLVVDDRAENLFAAREAGARTVLVRGQREPGYAGPVIARLADLLAAIEVL